MSKKPKPTKCYNNLPNDASYLDLLAVALAEKLCLRVVAVLEWVKKANITVTDLCNYHRQIYDEGVGGEFASKVLIAVVNRVKL